MPSVSTAARWTTTHVYGFEKYAGTTTASRPRRRTIVPRVKVGSVTLTILLVSAICCLAILSLLHSNRAATRGYELRTVQGQHEELLSSTKVLRMQVAQLQSLKQLDSVTGALVAGAVDRVKVEQRVALK